MGKSTEVSFLTRSVYRNINMRRQNACRKLNPVSVRCRWNWPTSNDSHDCRNLSSCLHGLEKRNKRFNFLSSKPSFILHAMYFNGKFQIHAHGKTRKSYSCLGGGYVFVVRTCALSLGRLQRPIGSLYTLSRYRHLAATCRHVKSGRDDSSQQLTRTCACKRKFTSSNSVHPIIDSIVGIRIQRYPILR